MTAVGTPYPGLDRLTAGFIGGQLIVVAARPSMGTTAFLSNLAEHMAIDNNMPVAYFSLDLPREQLVERLVCSHTNIDWQAIRFGKLSADELRQVEEARGKLADGPLHIDNSASVTVDQLVGKARQFFMGHDVKCIFIDHLQLMDHPGLTSECPSLLDRQNAFEDLVLEIKALARELGVPVVVAFPLSRPPADRPGNRPRISDLREARPVGDVSDVLMFLHNEDYFHRGEEDYEPTGVTDLIVAKNYDGSPGTVPLMFRPQNLRFEPWPIGGCFASAGRPTRIGRGDEVFDEDGNRLEQDPSWEAIDRMAALVGVFWKEKAVQIPTAVMDGYQYFRQEHPGIKTFVKLAYEDGWVIGFDWAGWDEGREIATDLTRVATADMLTIRKLITTLIRKERVRAGTLQDAYEGGLIMAILRRIELLRGEDDG